MYFSYEYNCFPFIKILCVMLVVFRCLKVLFPERVMIIYNFIFHHRCEKFFSNRSLYSSVVVRTHTHTQHTYRYLLYCINMDLYNIDEFRVRINFRSSANFNYKWFDFLWFSTKRFLFNFFPKFSEIKRPTCRHIIYNDVLRSVRYNVQCYSAFRAQNKIFKWIFFFDWFTRNRRVRLA